MGESIRMRRSPARSVALQPGQFRISNVCRTRTRSDALDMIDGEITRSFPQQRKKGETAVTTFHGPFTYAQSPFAPVPEVLHTKAESAAQQRVYKEFFHVWRGHSQSVCDAATGSSGTAAISRSFGVPQAYDPNSAPISIAFLTSQTAHQLSSDLHQVRIGDDSCGCLGGNNAAASTYPPVTSTDLSVAMLKCSTRLQPHHFRPSIVRRTTSEAMLKCSTRLQPRHFRPSTVRCTTSEKLREVIRKLHAEIFQSDALQKLKEHIELLQEELRNSSNLILEEQARLSLINDIHNIRPTFFIEEFGPKIMSMEKVCRANDKLLKDIETVLLLNFDHTDSLLSEVKNIQLLNQAASKSASTLASMVHDYQGRIDVEACWLSQFVKTTQGLSSRFCFITSEINDLKNYLSELSDITDDLGLWIHSSQEYERQICALRTLLRIWVSAVLSVKNCDFVVELATELCTLSKNLRNIQREKTELAERFYHAELAVEQEGPRLEQTISGVQLKVDMANRLYVEKLSYIPKDKLRSDISNPIFQKIIHDLDFSWRVREFNRRNIAPSIRTQGRGECTSVSTVSASESLYKKQHAARLTIGGQFYQAKEFIIKLSHNHLQDIVAQFFKMKEAKGKNKLAVCLEQMVDKGVLSESAYNHGDAKAKDYHRYRLNGFEEVNKAGFRNACDIIEQGNVLIGNMYITKDYFRLGPGDVYDVPPDAIIETNPSGQKCSHCVVIVGFGINPDGSGYYVFQNSYGPDWGNGGYGRVSSRSLKYLYSPRLA